MPLNTNAATTKEDYQTQKRKRGRKKNPVNDLKAEV